ncbi:esterase FE4-like [Maniola hyperantus]|uniref:esterase FE4-like n=1 Tax=Aphantopus hyperantus TaxID=2795564 RepID=UPI001568D963|nr:esterase FE4-like [Maniola hyperantus]
MLLHGIYFCACGFLVSVICEPASRLVNIYQGPVKGYMAPEGGVFVFYGIPYATAPTGPQKFRPPLPPPIWTTTFEALQTNIICPQNRALTKYKGEFMMQEDCLIANVYVPDTEETNLPVVVNVHGGAFQYGYGSRRAPIHLVQSKKVIAVNFNYRVGAHGFLCLGTEDVPGNAGMKDQVALLRWVQKNIAQFGGNPNDVTINGCSSGGASVDLLMISKMAKGLFHKVIPESGSKTAPFTVQVDPIANAKKIAKELNYSNVDDIENLEKYYKTAPYEKLYEVDLGKDKHTSFVFFPCVERNIGEEIFLDDDPVNIIKKGAYTKLPMLYGISDMEGIFRTKYFDDWKDQMNEKFADFIPVNLKFSNEEEKEKVAQKIKEFYFGNETINEESILEYIKYFSDVMVGYGTARSVKMHVEAGNSQIYLYKYEFVDDSTDYIPYTNIRGAAHCAQANAISDLGDESKLSQEYKNMKSVMRDLWLNFITTGKPVPDGSEYPAWPPVGYNRSPYMSLNRTLALKSSFLGNRAPFWDDIYDKHYAKPVLWI